ncbi:putative conjugative transfer protein [Escherichia coli]|uniref:hypothetical protein n=1 Tax=Escherichia coli TaxID=562 RepID=UPI0012DE1B84|nr:hypothetical protein [Escherichia coli]EEW6222305.1 hypothetical protein [Escherichia coli]EFN7177481.1 hypothetical protein [Escherichia coli]EIM8570230.1 hypothetical protein [Escherichia coli]EIQ0382068.1 hypothetical protein [Escherichia coli]EJN3557065.1 hypothetical protein [Escherichia coli]
MKKKLSSKYIHIYMSISCVLIRLISKTLKLFPFALVMVFSVLFYFMPENVITDIISEWQISDVSDRLRIIRLYLETTFLCTLTAVFFEYLCSDEFLPGKRVNQN